jgi:hypothetical protein
MTSVNAELFHREQDRSFCGGCGEHKDSCECDPTPWCSGCGATRKADCECGPLAEND